MPNLTANTLAAFKARINRLDADSRPLWGRMDAKTLVCHLRRALEISLGEFEMPDRSLPGLRILVRFLFFNVFTIWPPSRRRLPADWLPSAGQPFATEKKRLLEALDRFVETHEQDPRRTAVHTTLGPLTLQAWSHIHAVHFNHHFRQFRLLRGPEVLEYWRWILIPVLAVVAWFPLR